MNGKIAICQNKKKASEEPKQLRMFLTGPGGTGKTDVVDAVSNLMGAYGMDGTSHTLSRSHWWYS